MERLLLACKIMVLRQNAEYLYLSEGGRNLPHRVQISPFGTALSYSLPSESCGTSRGCSRRGHGDAAVPVDDPYAGRGAGPGHLIVHVGWPV